MAEASGSSLVTSDPCLERDTRDIHAALSDLIRVYQFRDRDRICCYDISVTQNYALAELVRRGKTTLNELAAALHLDKSTASRVVSTLERKAYVSRSAHPLDRRAVLLEATEAGRTIARLIRESILAEEHQMLANFTPEVRQSIAQLLARLARAAEASSQGTNCCPLP